MSHADDFPEAMKASGKDDGGVSVAPSPGSPAGIRWWPLEAAVLRDAGGPRPARFWHDRNGRIVAGRREAKPWAIRDALPRWRTSRASVAVSAHAGSANLEEAFRDTRRFLDDASASIQGTVPGPR